jgi:hypothetical protein
MAGASIAATVARPRHSFSQLPSRRTWAVAASLFVFAVTYFREFYFPNLPLALWGDQVGFFNDGSRIVAGQVPYRDYFKFLPPATDYLYATCIWLLGLRLWIPNLLMALTAASLALLVTLIAVRLLRGPNAILPALMLAGFVLLLSNDPTHHWFSTIAVLATVVCLLEEPSATRVLLAGMFCGVAMAFTQTKGVLVLLALALSPAVGKTMKPMRFRLLLCGAALAVFAAANAPFIAAAGPRRWLYCLVEFPLRYYPIPKVNNWHVLTFDFREHAGPLRWVAFPFVFGGVAVAYVGTWLKLRRNDIYPEDRRRAILLLTVGIAMLLAVISAPSIKRISSVAPPAIILLAWLLDRTGPVARITKLTLAAAALGLAIAVPAHVQLQPHLEIDVPAGRAGLTNRALYDEYAWLRANTAPGEYCFGMAPFYYTFHLRNPAPIEGYDPTDYTRPEQVSALVLALEKHKTPLIVLRWSPQFLMPTGLPSDHLGPFRSYLLDNYEVTKSFATGDDVWTRKPTR